jgi:ribosomal-protein-alanine N-acetyltransferase
MIPMPIETERLHIRAIDEGDIPPLSELFADAEVMRYISLRGRTVPQLIDEYRRRYDEHGFTFWAVCDASRRIVGEVGFGVHDPTGEPEVGWALARGAWGNGYATEATRAVIAALFAHTDHNRVVALVDVRNDRSLRTAERVGLTSVGVVDHEWGPHMLFEVRRS